MRFVSWNVNGIRAALKKGARDYLLATNADAICIQEVRAHPEQVELDLPGYEAHWNSAEKKGYSGTLVLTRNKPLAVTRGLGIAEHDREGRVITLEYPAYFLTTVYTPMSRRGLTRLEYRMAWDRAYLAYLQHLERKKPVVFCGDLNVAHQEIDLANPHSNRKNPGFTPEERAAFDNLLAAGFVDTFRQFCPEPGHYTWWSNRDQARERNIGWRLDYFGTSQALRPQLKSSVHRPAVLGSDHCPIELELG